MNNNNLHPRILRYLEQLKEELAYLPEEKRAQHLIEIEDHLHSLILQKIDRGMEQDQAVEQTLADFLPADRLAQQIIDEEDVMQAINGRKNERTAKTNSKAIMSLALGVAAIIIPLIGLVIGIFGCVISRKARNEIAQLSEKGEGIAIAGLVVSVCGIATQLFLLLNIYSV
ncbi:DUF4190 domain-containing protein [Gracilibacillus sp. S3-1-1]|uniref:DUF4190 domain-containing protein n=1 Tax=Gracilibacillus pellucidus TaxID=3095368 RepID=A0ACC6M9X7_9BACI|nr:DUF4190 domain-containing protein [Gracilibacillus sp. S3-1-1]MDX8047688.1 DUF4190 domain-containing protein [Gracilibacillus sp. S3-1-1]